MTFNLRLLVLGFIIIYAPPLWAHGLPKYRIIDYERESVSSHLHRTRLTVQQGKHPLNRFDVVRLRRSAPLRQTPPIILISPFGFPAQFWEIPDGQSYQQAFAPQLALAGHDVWLVDSRLAEAQPGQCESGAVDCRPMRKWGINTAVDDALFVWRLTRIANPFAKAVIGGLSGGSSTALATVNRRPHLFRGLFLWEGTLFTYDQAIRTRNTTFCEDDREALSQGIHYDTTVQVFKTLFQLGKAAPNDPTPLPIFPPGTTNLQALLFAITQPDPNNPLNFTESFIRYVGDPFAGALTHSELQRVLLLGDLVGNYAPIAFLKDSHCAMAGLDTSFTDRLDRFRSPALVFAEGLGFNQMMLDTATLLSRSEVTIDYQPSFGESDRYFHVNWKSHALAPLLAWLDTTH